MSTSKPLWNKEPGPDQTSIRFCCPHCFVWIRNRELEEHIKLAHSQDVATECQLDASHNE